MNEYFGKEVRWEDVKPAVVEGFNSARNFMEKSLGMDLSAYEHGFVGIEYVATVKMAEMLMQAERVVIIEGHAKTIKSAVRGRLTGKAIMSTHSWDKSERDRLNVEKDQEISRLKDISKRYKFGNTLKCYRETFQLVRNQTNARTIDDLDSNTLEQMFMKANAERSWSPYTFFTYHKNLKAFFNWAVVRGYVRVSPMQHIGRPRLPKGIPISLTEDQALKVIDASYHLKWYIKSEGVRNRAIVSTFIFAGLRRKELCDLKRQDVDLERRKIFIYDAKWGKDRVVPINSRLHFFLMEYAEKRDRKYRDNVHFFVGLRDHKPLGNIRYTAHIRKAAISNRNLRHPAYSTAHFWNVGI